MADIILIASGMVGLVASHLFACVAGVNIANNDDAAARFVLLLTVLVGGLSLALIFAVALGAGEAQ